ncbi:MAG: type II toxin-antitoxin system RatA family toxin [Cellvibrionaceae bacterium]
MARVSRSAVVPYSAQQMFDLINDIQSYPEFMTGCVGAEVLESSEECVQAKLTLGLAGIHQSFVTRNELLPPNQMKMHLVDGPFSRFEGIWSFDDAPEGQTQAGCKVGLELDFAFSNPLLGMTVGRMIEDVASQQVDALCQRAEKVYA